MATRSDPYLIPGTDVLHNKAGLTNNAELDIAEQRSANGRIKEMKKNPVKGNFDEKHLDKIHEQIFGDIYFKQGEHQYPIAGATRVIPISKLGDGDYPSPNDPFPDNNLKERTDYAFAQLKKDNNLQGIKDRDVFTTKLTKHIANIWENHKFREGNTRSAMMFTHALVKNAGLNLDLETFSKDPREFREALSNAHRNSNYGPLKDLLASSMQTPLQVKAQQQDKAKQKTAKNNNGDLYHSSKIASAKIETETQAQLAKLKARLDAEKKQLELTVKKTNTQIAQYTSTKAPTFGGKRHRSVGVMLETRLASAKHDLYEFNKKYDKQTPTLRKQAAATARRKNPEAVAVIEKWKEASKEDKPSRSKSKENTNSRGM